LAFAQNDDKIVVFHTCTSYAGFASVGDAEELIENVGYCTEPGHLAIELFFDDAPNTAESFLKLSESGFYDKTIFHRIMKGFMIQGGDPNSKNWAFPSEWGKGGEKYGGGHLKAEFNNIVHDRGIVSMARSTHPDSAGSQFFIVHEKSTHLDGQYTVFGRIITQESYDTLDKIANLELLPNSNKPDNPLVAEIKKTEIVTRSSLEGILILDTPERGEELTKKVVSRYSNAEYGFSFMPQAEWPLQPTGGSPSDPVLMALGIERGGITPSMTFEALETDDLTFKEYFALRLEKYHELDDGITFDILSEEYFTTNAGYNGLEMIATQIVMVKNTSPDMKEQMAKNVVETPVKFKQVMLDGVNFHYVISYANHIDYFDEGLASYDKIIDSFLITATTEPDTNPENDVIVLDDNFSKTGEVPTDEPASNGSQSGGGCLIATAAFGSEMAPQVQFLRELRDNTVLQTESGTSFMAGFNQFYYSFSPTIADYERENPIFKEAVKLTITPLLASLTLLQFADINSESEMLGYGIGVILLNIGIYFAVPAAFIMKIRKLQ
jgi:peptidyl-prolyl cis-trans isomerase B (cyclophilin B)